MSLRQRIVLTLAGITLLLALPAAYALVALDDLHTIIHTFRTRDAQALLSLGRLQSWVTAVSDAQVRYAALGEDPRAMELRARVDSASSEVARALEGLTKSYGAATRPAARHWQGLRAAIAEEHRLRAAGDARADSVQRGCCRGLRPDGRPAHADRGGHPGARRGRRAAGGAGGAERR